METDKTKQESILRVANRATTVVTHRVSFGDEIHDDVGREHNISDLRRSESRRSTESDLSLHSLTSSGGGSGRGSNINAVGDVKEDTMDQKRRKKGKKWRGARTLMSSITHRQVKRSSHDDAATAPSSLMAMKLPEDSETNNSTFASMPSSFSGQTEANSSSEGMRDKVRRISLKVSRNLQSTKSFRNERNGLSQSMPSARELHFSAPPPSNTRKSMTTRRECLDAKQLTMGLDLESANFLDWMTQAKCEEWLKSLRMRDPRFCIKQFFE